MRDTLDKFTWKIEFVRSEKDCIPTANVNLHAELSETTKEVATKKKKFL